MDIGTFTQLISSVGFPICVCLLCFWYIKEQQEKHKEEIDKLADAVNNNTLVIQRVIDLLEGRTNGEN